MLNIYTKEYLLRADYKLKVKIETLEANKDKFHNTEYENRRKQITEEKELIKDLLKELG